MAAGTESCRDGTLAGGGFRFEAGPKASSRTLRAGKHAPLLPLSDTHVDAGAGWVRKNCVRGSRRPPSASATDSERRATATPWY